MKNAIWAGLLVAIGCIAGMCANRAAAEEPTSKPATMEVFGPQKDWPRFRGPLGNGVTAEKGLPTKWDAKTGEGIAWSADVFKPKVCFPQHTYASPIVCGDKVFVALSNFKDELFVDPPKNMKLKEAKHADWKDGLEHKLACFRAADGKQLWTAMIEPGPAAKWGPGTHENQYSYAGSTPCTDGERVYVVFSSGVLAAVDFGGKVVWRQEELVKEADRGGFGMISASPTLYKDLVLLVVCLNSGDGFTAAFDRKTGEVRYNAKFGAGPGRTYGVPTPVPMILKGSPLLVVNPPSRIQAINPEDGKVVWFAKRRAGNFGVASLATGGGVVLDSEHLDPNMKGPLIQRSALALDSLADARGDITKDLKWTVEMTEYREAMGISPVISGDYAYIAVGGDGKSGDKVFCCEAATGKEVYSEKLPGRLCAYASPFATADGLIYYASSGTSFVVKAGPKFEVVASNELNDCTFRGYPGIYGYGGGSYGYASAAVAGGRIFILGHNKLWCVGQGSPAKN